MNDWESYWQSIQRTGEGGEVFWDSSAEFASREDMDRFRPYFDPDLPLVDLGCGNGRQTRFLAAHYATVIGVDVAEAAIRLARAETGPSERVIFRVFDAVDPGAAPDLHAEFGDMNIYMRGVLHMIKWKDRPQFIESLRTLLGERGTLYQVELTSDSILKLRSLPQGVFAQIPKVTRRVGFNPEDRERFYPADRWTVLDQGDDVAISSVALPDGSEGAMPGTYMILRPRHTEK